MIEALTQSILNMYARCPYQVYLRYVKNIIIPPGVAARKGSSVHSGIEHNYRHKIEKGEPASIDEVQDATRDKFTTLIKDEGVWFNKKDIPQKNEILNESLNESLCSSTFHHTHIAPSEKEIALVEERLYADVGVGMPISGKPDVAVDRSLKDIKTSKKRWPKGRENEEIQVSIYRILLRENGFGDLPADFVILSNMKNGPKDENTLWDNELKVCGEIRKGNDTPEYEQSVLLRIKIVSKLIKQGDFPPSYPGSWWCSPSWCGWFGMCPYVKGRKIFT